MAGLKVRGGDTVQVISGRTRASRARSSRLCPSRTGVIVEGVNRVKRHTKAGQGAGGARTGGIIVQEASIHVSNVMVVDEDGMATASASVAKLSTRTALMALPTPELGSLSIGSQW